MKKLTVGLICSNDWANYMYQISESLRTQCTVISYKLKPHAFNYAKTLPILNPTSISSTYAKCDIILVCHSDHKLIDMLPKNIKIGHIATGSGYRQAPELMNQLFSKSVLNLTDQCEFMKLSNFKYLPVPIDTTDLFPQKKYLSDSIIFSHYPSKSIVKGSDIIDSVMKDIPVTYLTSRELVSHSDQLDRIKNCDVYIELFSPEQNGKPYGCYGVTAFEAAALGKIVITMCDDVDAYTDSFGECPFILVSTVPQLIESILRVSNYSREEIIERQVKTREKIVNFHSMKVSGERLLSIIEDSLPT